jgi:precorrin-2/cobalt-factor-2 C20-methyltransferase
MTPGRCYGVGVGPGDPDLLTVKALRIVQTAPVVAYFAAVRRPSNARTVVEHLLDGSQVELRLTYPVTTEVLPEGVSYETLLSDFYDTSAKQVRERLDAGDDVAVLCEGDPLLHGSFMYMLTRLAPEYDTEVVPGVASMLAGAAAVAAPLVCRDETLSVISGVLPGDELVARLRSADAAVIMKVGRNLASVRDAVIRAELLERAWYVERATMSGEVVLPLSEVDGRQAPYFSMVVIPSATAPTR